MINTIWIIIEFLASLIECYMITHYIVNFLEFKTISNNTKKKILFFTLTVFNNVILSQYLQIDAVIGIIQLIFALLFSFTFMQGSCFKKIFVSFSSIFLILIINSGVLFSFSKILSEDIQVLISSIGIFRLLILFITKFLYYIVTMIIIKLFKKDDYKLSKEELIYILIIFFITLFVGNLMFEYALKNNNNFSMLFNIIFVFLVTANIISYILLRRIKINANTVDKPSKEINKTKADNFEITQNEEQINEQENDIKMIPINTGSPLINAIANLKREECNRKKIKFNINCTKLIDFFSEEDMGIVLSIVLDKTIEQCSSGKSASKIDLKITNENYNLSIIISFTRNDKFDSSVYMNNLSEDTIIKDIVKKYRGIITFDNEENLFIVNIWLKSYNSVTH